MRICGENCWPVAGFTRAVGLSRSRNTKRGSEPGHSQFGVSAETRGGVRINAEDFSFVEDLVHYSDPNPPLKTNPPR